MKIQDLIEKFEKECLYGTDRFRNIILYDSLLDKIEREEKMQWNLNNIRSYLSIIWHRLKKECPNVTKCYFSEDNEFVCAGKEKIVVQSYEDGLIIAFNTNLKNKYSDDIYCLIVKDDSNNKFVKLEDNEDNLYPFCTKSELSFLSKKDAISDKLKDIISNLINIIEQDFGGSLPSIKLEPKDFRCRNLVIKINESKNGIYTEGEHKIDPTTKTRIKRIQENKQRNKQDVENSLKGGKDIPESRLSGWDHIIIDGSDNLPLSFLNLIFAKNYHYIDKYNIQAKIIGEEGIYKLLKNIIQRAINRSLKKSSERNYVVPSYYIELNKISYLLPLYIFQREKPDCVLVFNKNNDEYVGNTLLSMDEARINTRVLSKIDDYKWMF